MDEEIPELVESLEDEKYREIISSKFRGSDFHTEVEKFNSRAQEEVSKKIPITIVTGYLGSGKSTLLDAIGKSGSKRLAIILNEFGDSSAIEKAVTIKDTEKNESIQEWLDLGNGCLCCTVKDNGVNAIEELIRKSKGNIDYILLETTGVADPAPIAKMFWLDEALASNVYIDGVVTVLDALNILKCLDDKGGHWHRENKHLLQQQTLNQEELTEKEIEAEQDQLKQGISTAHLQIALADVILLNKIDKVDVDNYDRDVARIVDRVSSINKGTPIHTTMFGDIALEKILDLHAFEANLKKLQSSINFTQGATYHDDSISTVTLTFPFFENDEFANIESFLQKVLWEKTANGSHLEVHRVKGILVKKTQDGDPDVRVIQGVRETYTIIEGATLIEGIEENKILFIGKNLRFDDLNQELQSFLL